MISISANLAFVFDNFFIQSIPFDSISFSFRTLVLKKAGECRKIRFTKEYTQLPALLLGSVIYTGQALPEVGELASPSE